MIVFFTIKAVYLFPFVSLARVPYHQSKKSRLLGFVMSVMLPEKCPDTLLLRPSNSSTNLYLFALIRFTALKIPLIEALVILELIPTPYVSSFVSTLSKWIYAAA